MLQSYREEIDEIVKYIAQPYKIPVLKKMIEPRYGQKPENEILLKKKRWGYPLILTWEERITPIFKGVYMTRGCRIDLDGSKRLEI